MIPKSQPSLKLFIIYDGVEEILVSAKDLDDFWIVMGEHFSEDDLDELMMSTLKEYPVDFQFGDITAEGVAQKFGRGIIKQGRCGIFKKPADWPVEEPIV